MRSVGWRLEEEQRVREEMRVKENEEKVVRERGRGGERKCKIIRQEQQGTRSGGRVRRG